MGNVQKHEQRQVIIRKFVPEYKIYTSFVSKAYASIKLK